MRMSYWWKDAVFTNLSPIFIAQFCFFVLFFFIILVVNWRLEIGLSKILMKLLKIVWHCTRMSYQWKDPIFTNFTSIFSKQIHMVANLHQSWSNLYCTISFSFCFYFIILVVNWRLEIGLSKLLKIVWHCRRLYQYPLWIDKDIDDNWQF